MSKSTFLQLIRPGLCIVAAALMLSTVPACIVAEELVYEPVNGNVAYSAVESLRYREPDARIAYGDDALQFGLLWLPALATDETEGDTRPPVVVLIHGGCWLNAYNIAHTYALSTALADSGYAVWSLEYRRTGDAGGGWPGTFDDVMSGIAHIKTLDRFALDTDRFVIAGHSAGGHLALLAGRDSPAATAVLGLAAISDIKAYATGSNSCQIATPRFMGGTPQERPDAYREANPREHLAHPTTVLLHGSSDILVPVNQGLMVGARTLFVAGGGHFDWVHPGTRSFRVLLSTLQSVLAQ
ncbi:alpha/beta hydrolase [Pseudohongiella sp.]|uniref:BD-FAE-like domain-containing protein n=1 Tax=marine sediment metagenome TaxID=412755 RepID=A0A0F9Y4Q2_9ZZZZ|nr:alpha/beta hydrolase [Pseudohongiella sp.]HDZ10065.1 alpha/beta hydrolase [Pseudohongiella sp.]HEA63414.1 alpha/beta hydrolase [Pseudohongiella sp.]